MAPRTAFGAEETAAVEIAHGPYPEAGCISEVVDNGSGGLAALGKFSFGLVALELGVRYLIAGHL